MTLLLPLLPLPPPQTKPPPQSSKSRRGGDGDGDRREVLQAGSDGGDDDVQDRRGFEVVPPIPGEAGRHVGDPIVCDQDGHCVWAGREGGRDRERPRLI